MSTPQIDTDEEVLQIKHVASFIVHLSAGVEDRSMKLISVIASQRILRSELVSAQLEEHEKLAISGSPSYSLVYSVDSR